MPRRRPSGEVARQNVLVIGLGIFGTAVAETLVSLGHEVLGVDEDPDVVADLAPRLTFTAEADGSSEQALPQLGPSDFSRGLVAVGDLEASVLAASNLIDIGVPQVWARALSDRHGQILERLGVHHVINPEREQGRRVGHLIGGTMLDFIEVDEGWALVKVLPLPESVGVTLGESRLRELYGITVVGTKQPGKPFQFAQRETVVKPDDTLIIAGETRVCEQFSAIAEAARGGR
jgi:trk system potassium uptake protein TrkA